MPANTNPIFSLTPNISGVAIPNGGQNTKSTGTATAIGTDIFLAFTAGANGSFIERVRLSAVASVAATGTTGTCVRLYVSTKSSGATTGGTDTFLIAEVAFPAQTADQSAAATNYYEVQLNIGLASGQTLLASGHATIPASTQIQVLVFGGSY